LQTLIQEKIPHYFIATGVDMQTKISSESRFFGIPTGLHFAFWNCAGFVFLLTASQQKGRLPFFTSNHRSY